jgi:hypothetical protein
VQEPTCNFSVPLGQTEMCDDRQTEFERANRRGRADFLDKIKRELAPLSRPPAPRRKNTYTLPSPKNRLSLRKEAVDASAVAFASIAALKMSLSEGAINEDPLSPKSILRQSSYTLSSFDDMMAFSFSSDRSATTKDSNATPVIRNSKALHHVHHELVSQTPELTDDTPAVASRLLAMGARGLSDGLMEAESEDSLIEMQLLNAVNLDQGGVERKHEVIIEQFISGEPLMMSVPPEREDIAEVQSDKTTMQMSQVTAIDVVTVGSKSLPPTALPLLEAESEDSLIETQLLNEINLVEEEMERKDEASVEQVSVEEPFVTHLPLERKGVAEFESDKTTRQVPEMTAIDMITIRPTIIPPNASPLPEAESEDSLIEMHETNMAKGEVERKDETSVEQVSSEEPLMTSLTPECSGITERESNKTVEQMPQVTATLIVVNTIASKIRPPPASHFPRKANNSISGCPLSPRPILKQSSYISSIDSKVSSCSDRSSNTKDSSATSMVKNNGLPTPREMDDNNVDDDDVDDDNGRGLSEGVYESESNDSFADMQLLSVIPVKADGTEEQEQNTLEKALCNHEGSLKSLSSVIKAEEISEKSRAENLGNVEHVIADPRSVSTSPRISVTEYSLLDCGEASSEEAEAHQEDDSGCRDLQDGCRQLDSDPLTLADFSEAVCADFNGQHATGRDGSYGNTTIYAASDEAGIPPDADTSCTQVKVTPLLFLEFSESVCADMKGRSILVSCASAGESIIDLEGTKQDKTFMERVRCEDLMECLLECRLLHLASALWAQPHDSEPNVERETLEIESGHTEDSIIDVKATQQDKTYIARAQGEEVMECLLDGRFSHMASILWLQNQK